MFQNENSRIGRAYWLQTVESIGQAVEYIRKAIIF